MKNYIRRVIAWVLLGKYHILMFTAVVITLLYLTGIANYYSTFVSSLLSISGLLIILWQQFLDVKHYSEYRPNTVQNWFKAFPRMKPITVTAEVSLKGIASISAVGTVSIAQESSLEMKVEFLLGQMKNINTTILNLNTRLDGVNSELLNKSEELKGKLETVANTLNSTIAGHIVGSYDINLFGIIITICGTLIQLFKV